MAIFRPGPDHKKRVVFNWAHWAIGMSAYILSGRYLLFVLPIMETWFFCYVHYDSCVGFNWHIELLVCWTY